MLNKAILQSSRLRWYHAKLHREKHMLATICQLQKKFFFGKGLSNKFHSLGAPKWRVYNACVHVRACACMCLHVRGCMCVLACMHGACVRACACMERQRESDHWKDSRNSRDPYTEMTPFEITLSRCSPFFFGEDAPRVSSRWEMSCLAVRNVVKFSVASLICLEKMDRKFVTKSLPQYSLSKFQNFTTLIFWDRSRVPSFSKSLHTLKLWFSSFLELQLSGVFRSN